MEARGDRKAHPLILASRFVSLPPPLYRRLFDREFRECIHSVRPSPLHYIPRRSASIRYGLTRRPSLAQADSSMLAEFDALDAAGQLPEWWASSRWTRIKFDKFLMAFRLSVARDEKVTVGHLLVLKAAGTTYT